MKRIVAASALLTVIAGIAPAEVKLTGDARMGLVGSDDGTYFTHRARVKFTLTGESDAGFSFGASFQAADAAGASDGTRGDVYISGDFGSLAMGDIDNAVQAVVNPVDGVGFTGLGDRNKTLYIGDRTTSARYTYSSKGFTIAASVGQNGSDGYAVAAAYKNDGYRFSIGYETGASQFWGFDGFLTNRWTIQDHILVGMDAAFGAVTFKARYSIGSGYEDWSSLFVADADLKEYAISATYTKDAVSLTAFLAATDLLAVETEDYIDQSSRFGIGASYKLGGGAVLKAGYVSTDYEGYNANFGDYSYGEDVWDLGLTFSF